MNKIKESPIINLLSGVIIGYAVTAIVFIGYAILLTYTDITDKHTELVVTITTLVSVIVSGFDTGKTVKYKGWFWGILAGLLYAIVMVLLGFFISDNYLIDGKSYATLAISIAGGGLGGILGINFKIKN